MLLLFLEKYGPLSSSLSKSLIPVLEWKVGVFIQNKSFMNFLTEVWKDLFEIFISLLLMYYLIQCDLRRMH